MDGPGAQDLSTSMDDRPHSQEARPTYDISLFVKNISACEYLHFIV